MMESFDAMIELRRTLGKKPCGRDCFMGVRSSQEEDFELDEFTIAKIKLGLQVFKFDPCNIQLYCDKDEVTCRQIYQYFQREFSENKAFPKYYVNTADSTSIQKNHKRGRSKKAQNLKNLEENLKRAFGIEPHPCYHTHYTCTEEEQNCMSEDCFCFKRGFCDKYCGCDLNKCKIRRKGCDCKSDCIGKKCPCHSINAECDPDLCKCCFNTREGSQQINSCQNQSIYFGKGKVM